MTFLVVKSSHSLCALPVELVEETMRPLPIAPLSGVPAYVRGVSIIRGGSVPVVDLSALLHGGPGEEVSRFVTLRVGGDRIVALAVRAVADIVALSEREIDIPPLLEEANEDAVSSIGRLDGEVLAVLRAGRLVPASVWAELSS